MEKLEHRSEIAARAWPGLSKRIFYQRGFLLLEAGWDSKSELVQGRCLTRAREWSQLHGTPKPLNWPYLEIAILVCPPDGANVEVP